MAKEIRTQRGKLIGTHDERTGILTIRDGKKTTQFKIPPEGITLSHTFSDGVTEEVHVSYCGKPNAA